MRDRADRYVEFARAYAEAGRRLFAAGVDSDMRLPFSRSSPTGSSWR